jgi:hypothetical protein
MFYLFGTFTLVILLSNKKDTIVWILFYFEGIGEVLLVNYFLKDDHIRLLLEFIGWIEPTSLSIVFS